MGPTRRRIERSYNRAMDITETMPIVPEAIVEKYTAAYLSCYKEGAVGRFISATKTYLRSLRKINRRQPSER
jgi:hypothetical protein